MDLGRGLVLPWLFVTMMYAVYMCYALCTEPLSSDHLRSGDKDSVRSSQGSVGETNIGINIKMYYTSLKYTGGFIQISVTLRLMADGQQLQQLIDWMSLGSHCSEFPFIDCCACTVLFCALKPT